MPNKLLLEFHIWFLQLVSILVPQTFYANCMIAELQAIEKLKKYQTDAMEALGTSRWLAINQIFFVWTNIILAPLYQFISNNKILLAWLDLG